MVFILQPTSKDLIMKALEQARPNLPQKPAKSTKGSSKPEMFIADDDDIEAAAASKPSSAASVKAASKAGRPSSAATLAAGKKVQLMFCLESCGDCFVTVAEYIAAVD